MSRYQGAPTSEVSGILTAEQLRLVAETTLIIPDNDGEAHLTIEIARRLWVDVRVSRQGWGATLEAARAQNPEILASTRKGVWLFEIPGKAVERDLEQGGTKVVVLDHHYYRDEDRTQPTCSLEQFLEMLGVTDEQLEALSLDPRFVQSVAVNDREYIYGLREAGFSEEEIRRVREYDMRAQLGERYEDALRLNEAIYARRTRAGNVTILRTTGEESVSPAVDRIVLDHPDEVAKILSVKHGADGELESLVFSGPTDLVQQLKAGAEPTYGGSNSVEKPADFVGWVRPDPAQLRAVEEILGISVAEAPGLSPAR